MKTTKKQRKLEIKQEVWDSWHSFCRYDDGLKTVNKFKETERIYALGFLDGLDKIRWGLIR
jgi:hypothetical protein